MKGGDEMIGRWFESIVELIYKGGVLSVVIAIVPFGITYELNSPLGVQLVAMGFMVTIMVLLVLRTLIQPVFNLTGRK